MKLRLFSIEIEDMQTMRLCFDSEINIEDLDKWRKVIGQNISVDVSNE
jgi:hypothetical protein